MRAYVKVSRLTVFCQWKGIVTGSRPLTSVEIDRWLTCWGQILD